MDLDKIRRGAELAMVECVAGNDHLAFGYCKWIKEYCRETLYEELYESMYYDP